MESSSQQHPNSSRLYHIYQTMLHHDYNVMAADKTTQLFFVDNSSLTPKKPDLTVHAGSTKQAEIVAAGKFLHFSRHFKVALGDPQQVNSVVWEDLVSQGWVHPSYRLQMTIRDGSSISRRSFVWKRTSSVGVGGSKPSALSLQNYKLVDEQSGNIVAVFTNSAYSYKKTGKLQVNVDNGSGFDLMVLTTVLCLFEKERRKNNSSGGGGGGGGGS